MFPLGLNVGGARDHLPISGGPFHIVHSKMEYSVRQLCLNKALQCFMGNTVSIGQKQKYICDGSGNMPKEIG